MRAPSCCASCRDGRPGSRESSVLAACTELPSCSPAGGAAAGAAAPPWGAAGSAAAEGRGSWETTGLHTAAAEGECGVKPMPLPSPALLMSSSDRVPADLSLPAGLSGIGGMHSRGRRLGWLGPNPDPAVAAAASASRPASGLPPQLGPSSMLPRPQPSWTCWNAKPRLRFIPRWGPCCCCCWSCGSGRGRLAALARAAAAGRGTAAVQHPLGVGQLAERSSSHRAAGCHAAPACNRRVGKGI